jgi:hypothetical protein
MMPKMCKSLAAITRLLSRLRTDRPPAGAAARQVPPAFETGVILGHVDSLLPRATRGSHPQQARSLREQRCDDFARLINGAPGLDRQRRVDLNDLLRVAMQPPARRAVP